SERWGSYNRKREQSPVPRRRLRVRHWCCEVEVMWQQVAVTVCVIVAALYLGRYVFDSVRAIVKARSGCGDGCAKCAFAEQPKKQGPKPAGSTPGSIIPLTDIRTLPPRQPQYIAARISRV